jgi:hypothetical protein
MVASGLIILGRLILELLRHLFNFNVIGYEGQSVLPSSHPNLWYMLSCLRRNYNEIYFYCYSDQSCMEQSIGFLWFFFQFLLLFQFLLSLSTNSNTSNECKF